LQPHRFRCGYTFRLRGTGLSSISEPGRLENAFKSGSSSISELGRLENAFKSGAFSKRYGFIGRVNGETASI